MDTTRISTSTHRASRPAARAALAVFAGAGIVTALAGCSPATAPATGSAATDASTGTSSAAPSSSAGTDSGGSSSSSSSTYKDGTYEAEGSYQSPGGSESVGVSITLAGDVVTAVTVTPEAKSGNSKQYQTAFAGGISGEVVGKKIDDLKVSKVSGSSLTSGGFNQALETIKSEAKA
jgi:uncharacterized protein with FMN-binding domain